MFSLGIKCCHSSSIKSTSCLLFHLYLIVYYSENRLFLLLIDPSSHPPFECDLPPDNPPPPATAPVAQPQTLVGNQSLMVQLTNPNSATVTARNIVLPGDQAAAQSVISAAIIMSNIAQYERAIEAVLHKAATGQDLTCYLAEVDPTADLDSIPPVTPKSVDLNTSDSTNATVVEQPESATSEHSNNTDLQSAQIALQTQQMTTQQTLANPGLVVRTGPQVGPPPQTPTAVMGSHTPTMGMHGRPAMWGYDSSAPSPHGAYIMASPGDPSMGFAPHDPVIVFMNFCACLSLRKSSAFDLCALVSQTFCLNECDLSFCSSIFAHCNFIF